MVEVTFELTAENIDAFALETEQRLEALNISEDDILQTRLSLETVLLAWYENGAAGRNVTVNTFKRSGRVYVHLSYAGAPINPIPEEKKNPLNIYFGAIWDRVGHSMTYRYANGVNSVELKLPKPEVNENARIIAAVILALLTGFAFSFLPHELGKTIVENYTGPLAENMIAFLSGMAMLMIFISLVAAVCNIGDVETLGTIGKATFLEFTGRTLATLSVVTPIAFLTFGILKTGEEVHFDVLKDVYKLVISIIPANPIQPFLDGNTLQIVFLAIFFGYIILSIGKKVQGIVDLVYEFNTVIMVAMETICSFLPALIYLSLSNILLKGEFDNLLKAWKIVLFVIFFVLLSMVVHIFHVAYTQKLDAGKLFHKLLPIFFLGATCCNASATIPNAHALCKDEYHIEDRIRNFAISFGQMFFGTPSGITMMVYAIGLADIYNVHVGIGTAITFFVCLNIVVYCNPPVPMGIMVVLGLLLKILGVPAEAIGIAMSIDFLLDMTISGSEATGIALETICLGKKLS